MENAAAFPTIQPLDYVYEKQDTTACPIWFEENVSTNLDKISKSPSYIASMLTDEGIPTPGGKTKWQPNTIISMLQNEKYAGNALLQKKFTKLLPYGQI